MEKLGDVVERVCAELRKPVRPAPRRYNVDTLKAQMETIGLSNVKLAELAGVTPHCVAHWRIGYRPVPPLVRRVLTVLSSGMVTVEEFGRM